MIVRKLRLQRGWSQEQLAEMSGLNVRTIQRLERNGNASTESLKSLPAVGWGIGLLIHGMQAFEVFDFYGSDWEKRQVEKRLGIKL